MKDPPWNPILFICATIATNQSRGARASIGVGVNRRQLWLQLRSWYQLLDITKKAIPAFFLAVVFQFGDGLLPGVYRGSTTGRLIEGAQCAMGGAVDCFAVAP
jgi:hypothetical protein